MLIRSVLHMVFPFCIIAVIGTCQTADDAAKKHRVFDVASIKPSSTQTPPGSLGMTLGKISWDCHSMRLVDILFMLNPFPGLQIKGGPKWIQTDRFDISAKVDSDTGEIKPDDAMGMVQALLEDRFKLVAHRDTKEVNGFLLVVRGKEPKLNPSKDGQVSRMRPGSSGELIFQKTDMYAFAIQLANLFQVPVTDGTGLKGTFDFVLEPNRFSRDANVAAPTGEARGELYVESVRAAVEDLGFSLQSRKVTSVTLIIDNVEKPTVN
jgi:uncharacterized protein (TIGR03435 family)